MFSFVFGAVGGATAASFLAARATGREADVVGRTATKTVEGLSFSKKEGTDVLFDRAVRHYVLFPPSRAERASLARAQRRMESDGGKEAFCVATAYAASLEADRLPPLPLSRRWTD